MGNSIFITLMLLMAVAQSLAFSPSSLRELKEVKIRGDAISNVGVCSHVTTRSLALNMGFFDGISQAFSNKEFKAQDQRVRASHILIKGDDVGQVLGKIKQLMGELNERVQQEAQAGATSDTGLLLPVFSELARRESQCPSGAQGGDLGLFGPGKMVKEFDDVLFPQDKGVPPPPVGAILGPVVTDFGCHVILVTQRDSNRDQVEEKLARND